MAVSKITWREGREERREGGREGRMGAKEGSGYSNPGMEMVVKFKRQCYYGMVSGR